jgi:hypothetical protein
LPAGNKIRHAEASISRLRKWSAQNRHESRRSVQLRKGDRIELRLPRLGLPVRGTVYYVDDLQILVKWDDGRSESLRSDFADRFRIVA